jgi:uncharacterized protein (TIGR02391 family)
MADSEADGSLCRELRELISNVDKLQSIMIDVIARLRADEWTSLAQREEWVRVQDTEYDNLYLDVEAAFESLRQDGVRIRSPNSFRRLSEWRGGYYQQYPQKRADYVVRDILYRDIYDKLQICAKRLSSKQLSSEELLDALREQFGQSSAIKLEELHATVVQRCKEAFDSDRFDEAILAAMKGVEDAVRRSAGAQPDDVGVKLVSQAMGPPNPVIAISAIPAEQEGAHALFRGAIGFFKNPHSHRFVEVSDRIRAFETLVFASLLLHLLDDAAAAKVGANAP